MMVRALQTERCPVIHLLEVRETSLLKITGVADDLIRAVLYENLFRLEISNQRLNDIRNFLMILGQKCEAGKKYKNLAGS